MVEGTISGMTLARLRGDIAVTQTDLAESIGVGVDTVKGWESARRPLTRAKTRDVSRLRFRLRGMGAHSDHLQVLDAAIRADDLLDQIVDPDPAGGSVLAHEVLTRRTCDLLTWPLTGRTPRELGGRSDRPRLGAGQRRTVHDALRHAADSAVGAKAPMVRRQAAFLLATDPDAVEDLQRMADDELRRLPQLGSWTPAWPVARGLAIAQSVAGDLDPLRAFLTHGCVTEATLTANLVYYLHYTGEIGTEHESDEFMAVDPGGWHGDVLLRTLTASLAPTTPYVELVIRTMWSLLERRPGLLVDTPSVHEVDRRVVELLDWGGELSSVARGELGTIHRMTSARGAA
ncbi:helix-turn-helix domain-containing protein [Actinomycetospora soli]|uniref:helix-turn-helix domain-containing protein n=1 Tax=Actinomycetospora soli TaxID=2893887 RepID=UPI001E3D1700|nr:hypothetical protein [Actinomycetospora soli]MCD2191346.1 hypothetical protein [Actinomycetospora soli]